MVTQGDLANALRDCLDDLRLMVNSLDPDADDPLAALAMLRERLDTAAVPAAMKGPAITLLTAGIMSMAFLGFSGLTRL